MFLCGKPYSVPCQYFTTAGCLAPFFCPYKMVPQISLSDRTTTTYKRMVVGSKNADDTTETVKETEVGYETREEQIAEMAKEMRNYGYKHLCAGRVFYYGFCEHLYDAGYRKQSDTAREILQYLYEKMGNVSLSDTELVLYLAAQYDVEVEE